MLHMAKIVKSEALLRYGDRLRPVSACFVLAVRPEVELAALSCLCRAVCSGQWLVSHVAMDRTGPLWAVGLGRH